MWSSTVKFGNRLMERLMGFPPILIFDFGRDLLQRSAVTFRYSPLSFPAVKDLSVFRRATVYATLNSGKTPGSSLAHLGSPIKTFPYFKYWRNVCISANNQ